jgi:hypothetical protein
MFHIIKIQFTEESQFLLTYNIPERPCVILKQHASISMLICIKYFGNVFRSKIMWGKQKK